MVVRLGCEPQTASQLGTADHSLPVQTYIPDVTELVGAVSKEPPNTATQFPMGE
jgi:hypothetical protein